MDQGHGSCILAQAPCAKIVQDSILYLDQKKYELHAWVVMPNHVHLLVRFDEGQTLSAALHSLKSFTAHQLKKLHPELAAVWQREYFDRYIRSESHYWNTRNYIHRNPVMAKLCNEIGEFPFSSAFAREE